MYRVTPSSVISLDSEHSVSKFSRLRTGSFRMSLHKSLAYCLAHGGIAQLILQHRVVSLWELSVMHWHCNPTLCTRLFFLPRHPMPPVDIPVAIPCEA